MAVINQVGNALTGSTGSGSFVGATSPTLLTPILGVASATSMNFGQTALNYYEESSFTPTVTFSTPGDVSISYSSRSGDYTRIGDLIYANVVMIFTPTYTTASGDLRIASFPFVADSTQGGITLYSKTIAMPFPASCTYVTPVIASANSYVVLRAFGSAVSQANCGTTEFPSGVARTIAITVLYKA